jgi:hypothetical protein
MTTDRLTNAIERARKEASNPVAMAERPQGSARPVGGGRPRIHSQGLSEIEAKWDKILKPDCL